jgi:hypothetical protein
LVLPASLPRVAGYHTSVVSPAMVMVFTPTGHGPVFLGSSGNA